MSKNKVKNKKGKRGHHRNDNANYLLGVIKGLGKDANLKTIFPKVLRKMSQAEIVLALNKLEHQGLISLEQKGKIKIIEEEKYFKKRIHDADFLFGIADVTQSGAAFVSVDELEKDVYIQKKFVGNTMQGDEVKIRLIGYGKRPEGQIVEVIKHAQDSFSGRVEVLEKFAFFISDERQLNTDVFIPLDALNNAKNNDRVIVRITE